MEDLLYKCCNDVSLIDDIEELFMKSGNFTRRELKLNNMKQLLVSEKITQLNNFLKVLKDTTSKAIIYTHEEGIIKQLKKFFKDNSVACFTYQSNMVVDNVYRFNLFGGQAVFLLQHGQSWNRDVCSFFDLDFIQNILIFD